MSTKRLNLFKTSLLSAVLFFPLVPLVSESPEILVILSYDPSFPTTPEIMASLAAAFPIGKYELFVHSMNAAHIPEPEYAEHFIDEIRLELEHSGQPDLVLTYDDSALRFAAINRERLFPGVTVVFAGVNDFGYAQTLSGIPGITGVMESLSLSKTAELMKSLFPEMETLDILVDETRPSQSILDEIKNAEIPYPLEITNASRMDEAAFRRFLGARSPDMPLLLIGAFSGDEDNTLTFWESLELMRTATESPLFHLWQHGVGNGILGGIVVSPYEQTRLAAEIAKRILAGERAEAIPVVTDSPNLPVFDWNELIRFNISPKELPPGSKILNRPLGLRESQPTVFWLLIVIGTAIAGLVASLILVLHNRTSAARQLAHNVSFLKNLIDAIGTPVYLKDRDGKYIMANTSFSRLFKIDNGWITGKGNDVPLEPETAARLLELDRAVFRDRTPRTMEINILNGQKRLIFRMNKVPIEDMNGTLLVLGTMQDITADRQLTEQLKTENTRLDAMVAERTRQLERANRELQAMAETDQLTGLANRRKIDSVLLEEIGMAKRYNSKASFIMFDLDHFKEVNDKHGHTIGDAVLVAVAEILAKNCRTTDLAGRWGGEEFFVICRGSEITGAEELADKLREIINGANILPERRITASFGVCTWQEGDTNESIVQRADSLLYRAKHAGRNRVVTSSSSSDD